ncbi:DUF4123 domain-containing protein [Aeromonas veronii]|uniref:DUF4123 domain-containing protein n=1 Tax=Aeromonas veronii TaxID=654 RepID=UPI003DA28B16
MTFQEWRSQHPGQLFAIVDAALDTTAVADYCNQGGANAIPLFAGTAFADQAEQGPWLLPDPAPEFIAAHPQLGGRLRHKRCGYRCRPAALAKPDRGGL